MRINKEESSVLGFQWSEQDHPELANLIKADRAGIFYKSFASKAEALRFCAGQIRLTFAQSYCFPYAPSANAAVLDRYENFPDYCTSNGIKVNRHVGDGEPPYILCTSNTLDGALAVHPTGYIVTGSKYDLLEALISTVSHDTRIIEMTLYEAASVFYLPDSPIDEDNLPAYEHYRLRYPELCKRNCYRDQVEFRYSVHLWLAENELSGGVASAGNALNAAIDNSRNMSNFNSEWENALKGKSIVADKDYLHYNPPARSGNQPARIKRFIDLKLDKSKLRSLKLL